MSDVAQVRELLFAWPCPVRDLAEWFDTEVAHMSSAVQGLTRTRQAVALAPTRRGVHHTVYTLTPKGRAKVLDTVRACEVCGGVPTVDVRVFATSDPLTTRVVCQAHVAQEKRHDI